MELHFWCIVASKYPTDLNRLAQGKAKQVSKAPKALANSPYEHMITKIPLLSSAGAPDQDISWKVLIYSIPFKEDSNQASLPGITEVVM